MLGWLWKALGLVSMAADRTSRAVESVKALGRTIRRPGRPRAARGQPLPWKDVAHQQDQIRAASRPYPPPTPPPPRNGKNPSSRKKD